MSSSEDASLTKTGPQGYNLGVNLTVYIWLLLVSFLPPRKMEDAQHYPSLSCLTLELVSRPVWLSYRVEATSLHIPSAIIEQVYAALPQGEDH